jgi:hypothetical protein
MMCSAGTGALEAEWRRECLAFARVRKLAHVEEMRVLYLVRRPCLPVWGDPFGPVQGVSRRRPAAVCSARPRSALETQAVLLPGG